MKPVTDKKTQSQQDNSENILKSPISYFNTQSWKKSRKVNENSF